MTQRARRLSETAVNERQQRYMEFWGAFGEYLSEHDPTYSNRAPGKVYWWTFGIGRSGYSLNLTAGGRDHWISASIVCTNDGDKLVYDHFFDQKSEIEADLGEEMEWHRIEDKITWDIGVSWRDIDPMNKDRWPGYFDWYWEKMQKLRAGFTQRIRSLDIGLLQEASASGGEDPPK